MHYRNRINCMLAAPIVTLPAAIASQVCSELLGRPDPAWGRLASRIQEQMPDDPVTRSP
ncbi:hypothetical protein ACR6C2_07960 [Streptomyces sp. INA 01156]